MMLVSSPGARKLACIFQAVMLMLPLPALAASPPKLKSIAPIYDNSKSSHSLNSGSSSSSSSSSTYSDNGADLPPPSPSPSSSYASRSDNDYTNTASNSESYGERSPSGPSEKEKNLLRAAISAYQSGNTTKAEQNFRQVLQMDSGNSDAHFSLGAIAESRGDLEGADQHYHAALRSNPEDLEIQQAVKALESKMHDHKTAQQQQRQVAQQEQQRAQLKKLTDSAAKAYRDGKYDVAINDLQEVARQDSNDPDVQYALAQAYRGKGDLNQARNYINQAISRDPNNQMYQAVLSGIDQDAASAGSHGGQQYGNNRGARSPYGSQMASASDSVGQTGQITPIQPEVNPPSRGPQYGYATMGGGMAGMLPGLLGMGMGRGYGMGNHGYGGSGQSRIKRAVIGSLAGAASGAAMAAMFNHSPGSVKQGAVRGALFGGMAGLIFGGF